MSLVSSSRITDDPAREPLLSYGLTTSPDPLKASPENPDVPEETGELIIVGSRRHRDPADLQLIKVKVPVGTMAPDLGTKLSNVVARISLDGWTPRLDESTDEFVFTPAADNETIGADTGFTVQLSQIPINRKVGTAPITVTERSRTGSSAFQDRSTTLDVGKFPADFYLRNLITNPLVIDNGGETTLTWERSTNATYELIYGDTSLNVTNVTTRTITNVKSDTAFYLRGTTGDPTNPVVRILTAQVTVNKPDLDIGNLTVNGSVIALGDVITNGRLTVRGPTDLIDEGILLRQGLVSASEYKFFIPETSGIVIGMIHLEYSHGRRGTIGFSSQRASAYDVWEHNLQGAASAALPVRKGERFSAFYFHDAYGSGTVRWAIRWLPFGRGGCTEISPEDVSPELRAISESILKEFPSPQGEGSEMRLQGDSTQTS